MKKIYYLVCACVFSTVFHLNAQTTYADAIPFDWSANNIQEAETTVWYKVSLTPLKNEEGMDLKLYINNASATETANVSCTVYIGRHGDRIRNDACFDVCIDRCGAWRGAAALAV